MTRIVRLVACALTILSALAWLAGCAKKQANVYKAASKGDIAAVRTYLADGGDINAPNAHGCTLLYLAALGGQKDVVTYLVSKGADINACNTKNGETPLSVALTTFTPPLDANRKSIAKLLMSKGARVGLGDAVKLNDIPLLKRLINEGQDVNASNKDGWTALYTAAYVGNVEAGKILIDKGASVNIADGTGDTPLHVAAQEGRASFVELLINKGAKVNARDSEGDTPFRKAVLMMHAEAAAVLRKHGGKEYGLPR